MMRIAFLTPEFVTDYQDSGGLGNYLNRMSKLLLQRGHEPEIFTSSRLEPHVLVHEGIRVERIPPSSRGLTTRILRRIYTVPKVGYPFKVYVRAHAMAVAMERRHREAPFDIVQSADYHAVGLRVRRLKGRVHVVRCSSAADLYNEIDGFNSEGERWRERLERAAMRRADIAYAPSQFIAKHFQQRHGISVEVVRPPADLEVTPSTDQPCGLPERFLVHFGQLSKRKGTHWLAKSLTRAFELEPALQMVWVGKCNFRELSPILASLGRHRSKVQVLYPLPKPQLYGVLQRADAAVLPSLVDNLPNTVIESLMMGIPVIGTRGASIDELVQQDVTGELVALGDVEGLAAAMVRVWKGQSEVRKGFSWLGGVAEEMRPDNVVESLLRLAQESSKER